MCTNPRREPVSYDASSLSLKASSHPVANTFSTFTRAAKTNHNCGKGKNKRMKNECGVRGGARVKGKAEGRSYAIKENMDFC